MNIQVVIRQRSSHNEFADSYLVVPDAKAKTLARLDVSYGAMLDRCGVVPEMASDLLLVASTVYAVDKLIPRVKSEDAWTREINLDVPVADPASWKAAASTVESCVSFLTGDTWHFTFTRRRGSLIRPSAKRRTLMGSLRDIDTICLFSGGLDSLIGVIDRLETTSERLLLIGHHDPHVPGPLSEQRELLAPIVAAYPGRAEALLVRVGIQPAGEEISFRSRSLIFLALALHVAGAAKTGIPVLIPENGNIALNVPLTASRQGSCSTRTAHPHYLRLLTETIRQLGLASTILNPLSGKTKGECVRTCRNQTLLGELYSQSVSCAKHGHRSSWIRRTAGQCGRCMPCIYRRAALHAARWDDDIYGIDFLSGEVPMVASRIDGSGADGEADVRAMLAFVRARPSARELSRALIANGRISSHDLPAAVALVERAMQEVRQLVADKGVASVRQAAGVGSRSVP